MIRAGWPAAFTHSRYSVAPLTAAQVKLGVACATAPLGATRVAGPGGAVRVTVSVALAVLFAASRATTVITVTPAPSGMALIVHAVVPAATPLASRSVDQVTSVTATLSLAVPLITSVSLLAA